MLILCPLHSLLFHAGRSLSYVEFCDSAQNTRISLPEPFTRVSIFHEFTIGTGTQKSEMQQKLLSRGELSP